MEKVTVTATNSSFNSPATKENLPERESSILNMLQEKYNEKRQHPSLNISLPYQTWESKRNGSQSSLTAREIELVWPPHLRFDNGKNAGSTVHSSRQSKAMHRCGHHTFSPAKGNPQASSPHYNKDCQA
jgi:hypothetical protein